MKNKMTWIIIVIVVLFAALVFVITQKNKQAVDNNENPYGKDTLKQETIDLLDDPLYDNIITPDDLDAKLDNGEDLTVYYFSPTCVHCQRTTPVVVPVAEDMDVDMKKMNLLEFDKMDYYDIEGTPTIVHYEDGEEVDRIVGEQSEEDFKEFFEKNEG
ncbi:MAG TPA: thioredoxin family protein [Pseudogracilibacillus sp.]|nr:thioredoxin family protein [Pseudogracilibacillus sp.]